MGSTIRTRVLLAVFFLVGCEWHDGRWDNRGDGASHATDARTAMDRFDPSNDVTTDAPNPVDVRAATDANRAADGVHCSSALPIAGGSSLTDQHTPSAGEPSTQCEPSDAPQRFYSFVLPAHMRAVLTVTPAGDPWRVVLRALTACDALDCLSERQSMSRGAPVTMAIDSPGDDALTKFVSVSGTSSTTGGAFDIALRLEPIGSAPACSLAVARALVLPRDTASGTLSGPDPGVSPSCGTALGGEHVYSLHVSEHIAVDLAVSSFDGIVSIRRACSDPSTEVACSADGLPGTSPHPFLRALLDPGDYFVVVDSRTSGAIDYVLQVTAHDVASNASCDHAIPVSSGTLLRDVDQSLGGMPDRLCGFDDFDGTIGEMLYYSASIPSGHTLLLDGQAIFEVRSNCSAAADVCLASYGSTLYRNTTASTQDVIIVATRSRFTPQAHTLSDIHVSILPPAANATCAGATDLGGGARFRTADTIVGSPAAPSCGSASTSPVHYYSAVVPPANELFVTARLGFERSRVSRCEPIIVRLSEDCGSTTCTVDPSNPSIARFRNTQGAPRRVFFAVGCSAPFATAAIDVDAAVIPPLENASCAAATPVADGTVLFHEGPIGPASNTATCLPPANDGAAHYVANVPANSTLFVRGFGHIAVADSCDAVTCLARNDSVATFANDSLTARDVHFALTGDASDSVGGLDVRIVPSAGSRQVAEMALGVYFQCARRADGTVACAGLNDSGQLGIDHGDEPIPSRVDLANVAELSAGWNHVCAALADGTVRCWGRNYHGQLGDGSRTDRHAPVLVTGLTGEVKRLALGEDHSCALLGDHSVRCWGINTQGQIGDGTTVSPRAMPNIVRGLEPGAVQIAAGDNHTCALMVDGTVRCWGAPHPSGAVAIAGLSHIVQIVAGGGDTCALEEHGAVACWGPNASGELGASIPRDTATPQTVPAMAGVVRLALGSGVLCGQHPDGSITCMGSDNDGRLGNGPLDGSPGPVEPIGSNGLVGLVVGPVSSCGIRGDGTALCWGANIFGGLGDASRVGRDVPTATLF